MDNSFLGNQGVNPLVSVTSRDLFAHLKFVRKSDYVDGTSSYRDKPIIISITVADSVSMDIE